MTRGQLLTVTVLLGLAPAVALAVDNKTMPGSACASSQGGPTSGGAFSFSVTGAEAVCPIVRDNTTNTTGLDDLDVYGLNQNDPGTDTFSCTAYAKTAGGNTDDSYTVSTTTLGTVSFSFGTNINVSSSGGNYVVVCTAGALDYLYSYVSSEP